MKWEKRVVVLSLVLMNFVDEPTPEVKIKQGVLTGRISADGSIYEYLGIPYGTANRTNRFQAPYPPPSWKGVYKAVEEMYTCPQTTTLGVYGVEDCLKVNVYVPVVSRRPLAVMVYIHGGAFEVGNGGKLLYAPDFLVHKDVILVTLNYRLGILGLLCLNIKEAPGNAALKDQIAALRWVKENIASFGGDPDNITLFGLSAGATFASLLLATNATQGLFDRVILQSGSATASWSINRKPIQTASLIAKELGYETNDPYELYKIFSEQPINKLIIARPFVPQDTYFDGQLLHLPCVEKKFDGVEQVIDDLPFNLLKRKQRNIPVIHGTTSKEGLLLVSYDTDEAIEALNNTFLFASDLEFSSNDVAKNINERVKEFYFKDKPMDSKMDLSEYYTHIYFEVPALLESELLINNSAAPVYNYYFDYSGLRNFMRFISAFSEKEGASHADDMFYLFKGYFWSFWISPSDQKVIEWMTTMWTNFAKYGDPTPSNSSHIPVRWEPSDRNNLKLLYIQQELKMGPVPNQAAHSLWKEIYTKHRRRKL